MAKIEQTQHFIKSENPYKYIEATNYNNIRFENDYQRVKLTESFTETVCQYLTTNECLEKLHIKQKRVGDQFWKGLTKCINEIPSDLFVSLVVETDTIFVQDLRLIQQIVQQARSKKLRAVITCQMLQIEQVFKNKNF